MTIKNDFGIFWAVLNQKSTLFCKDAFFKYIQFYSPTRSSLQLPMCYDMTIKTVWQAWKAPKNVPEGFAGVRSTSFERLPVHPREN